MTRMAQIQGRATPQTHPPKRRSTAGSQNFVENRLVMIRGTRRGRQQILIHRGEKGTMMGSRSRARCSPPLRTQTEEESG